MLRSLSVRNYVLIDSLEIDFPAGLVIITGQTGAGKSILLGALSLVLGSKADAGMVGENGDNCVVEAEFSVAGDAAAREIVEDAGLEWNGGSLTIRRVLGRSGRSRSFVNDEPVQVGVLSALSGRLLDIHSQHQTMMLSDHAFQLSLLDHYAGLTETVSRSRALWKNLTSLRSELSDTDSKLRELALQRDYIQAQYGQLEDAKLQDGELEELEAEQMQLAHAEEIKLNLMQALQRLSPEDGESIDSALKEAVRLLDKVGQFIPAASSLSERMESSRLELDDILSEVSDLESRTDVSEDRLQIVDDRLSLLYELLRKHSCRTVGELIAERDRLSGMLFDSTSLQERCEALEKEISSLSAQLGDIAAVLHEGRIASAATFSQAVQSLVRSLELDQAVFSASVEDDQPGPAGRDSVRFLFSASGRNPVDVSRCASGGELSRIMLALKAMLARYAQMPAMVFDEIDTGVSGSAADAMGSLICRMGEDMQVFAITHLPQVAAKGQAHYLVSKQITSDGKAVSTISRLDGEQRVQELARMLSGATVTPEAVANARALLG